MDRFEDYQKEALKTASSGKGREMEGFVRVCGLVGEAAELRDELVNWLSPDLRRTDAVRKELGDVLWYAATLSSWLDLGVAFDFDTLQRSVGRRTLEPGVKDIILARAGKLAELMKKHLGHDKPMASFNGREFELMQDVFVAIAYVANTVGLRLSEVADLNIAKLRARYQGGGFTSQLVNAHVDEHAEWKPGPV